MSLRSWFESKSRTGGGTEGSVAERLKALVLSTSTPE